MTIISLDHENEIQFFRNILPCPRILKMIQPPCEGTLACLVLRVFWPIQPQLEAFEFQAEKN